MLAEPLSAYSLWDESHFFLDSLDKDSEPNKEELHYKLLFTPWEIIFKYTLNVYTAA